MDRVNRSYYGTKNSNSSSITHSAYNQEIELIGVIRKTEKVCCTRVVHSTKTTSNLSPFSLSARALHGEEGHRPRLRQPAGHEQDLRGTRHDAHLPGRLPVLSDLARLPREDAEPGGGRRPGSPFAMEHLSYIVTWYSLTGILSYLWYKKIFKLRL